MNFGSDVRKRMVLSNYPITISNCVKRYSYDIWYSAAACPDLLSLYGFLGYLEANLLGTLTNCLPRFPTAVCIASGDNQSREGIY